MTIIKRTTLMAVTLMCIISALSGCTTSKDAAGDDEAKAAAKAEKLAKEMQQNDYRGGVTRTNQLKEAVLDTMETMKSNNGKLRDSKPNSFWSDKDYQDFVVNFLSQPIINDTQWFNEEETSWEDIVSWMGSVESSFTQESDGNYSFKEGIQIERNEKDDYSILNVPVSGIMFTNKENSESDIKGTEIYNILYDCDKDWCKAYSLLDLNTEYIPDIVPEIYEYARLDDNTFLVQTSRERLMVILDPAENDTAFSERTVKEFYYSKLVQNGMRTTFDPYHALAEYDDETGEYLDTNAMKNRALQGYKILNSEGDIATQYGRNDSMFLADDVYKLGIDWVFEDSSLQQAICYKDRCLVVTTYNKLTEEYERFTYSASTVSESDIKALEDLVNDDELVGDKRQIDDIDIPQTDMDTISKNKDADDGEDLNTVDAEANEKIAQMRDKANAREDGDVEYIDSPE